MHLPFFLTQEGRTQVKKAKNTIASIHKMPGRRSQARLEAARGITRRDAIEKILSATGITAIAGAIVGNLALNENYENEMDGITVTSKSVPISLIREKYERAKEKLGGGKNLWKPKRLSIEIDTGPKLAQKRDDEAAKTFGSEISTSSTNEAKDIILISDLDSLEHELIHVLLGPVEIPDLLEEFIASVAESHPEFKYNDLDKPWVQMSHPESMRFISPLTFPRTEALKHAAHRYAEKIPELAKIIRERKKISFAEMEELLQSLGIEHHILRLGSEGEQIALIPFHRGYFLVRYFRNTARPEDGLWEGTFTAEIDSMDGFTMPTKTASMLGTFVFPALPEGKIARQFRVHFNDQQTFEFHLE